MKFYDPVDNEDLTRVETILHRGGIEYFLVPPPQGSKLPTEIQVAEEDVPRAEELLLQAGRNR